ncbi:hypothetical protein HS088_TW16G00288 [Tripterygium wilfordii]|uniref:Uncharacterized protein n=1 Tax=Tripterygium wilfordii TaxID=458696 RepID=A0A7J7CIG8_TRIWF|nr:hypothetical protein HS088_TW16G00288 [Tripterygium wilfordii]
MEAPMKYVCFLLFLVILGISWFNGVNGAGECGNHLPNMEAFEWLRVHQRHRTRMPRFLTRAALR